MTSTEQIRADARYALGNKGSEFDRREVITALLAALDDLEAKHDNLATELRTALDALARLGKSLGTDLADAYRRGWEEGQAAIADD